MANEADTVWQPSVGEGEYQPQGVNNIADPQGKLLADPSGALVVDTGLSYTEIPATVFTSSPGS